MRHLVYNVRNSVILINSSLVTVTLHSSVKTTFFCEKTNYPSCSYNRLRLYVATDLMNQNCIYETIIIRLYLVKAWYHSALSLLFSSLLSKISRWKYAELFLAAVSYRCQIVRSTRWRSWLRHCATSRMVAGSISDGVTGIFHWRNPLHNGSGVDSASNRNGYQKYFLGVKAASA